MKRWGILLACLGALGCDDVTTSTLEVAPYKSLCSGLGPLLCLQVREPEAAAYRNLLETPEGFEFEWGFEYTIIVEERERNRPPADASSIARRLDRIVSMTPAPAGTSFELGLLSAWLRPASDSSLELIEELTGESLELACPGEDCTALLAALQAVPRVEFTLSFPATVKGLLPVIDWRGCDTVDGVCGEAAN